MPTSVTMPALGESVTEGTVTRWLKQEGEQVEVDEPLLEVSTDKVDTEIPSPAAGVLTKILVAEDETVEVGAELAVIGGGDGGSAARARRRAASRPAEPAAEPEPEPAQEEAPAPQQEEQPAAAAGLGRLGRWRRGHLGDHAGAGRERHRGHRHPLAEVGRRRGDGRRAAAGGVHRQGRHRDPVAGQRHAARDHGRTRTRPSTSAPKLAVIGTGGGAAAAASAPAQPTGRAEAGGQPSPSRRSREQEPSPSRAEAAAGGPEAGSSPPAARAAGPGAAGTGRPAGARPGDGGGSYVTPLVRRLAAERGVDLSAVSGTGVGGRIRKQDVLAAAEQAAAPAPAAAAQAPATRTPSPAAMPDTSVRGRTEKLSRLRAVIARRMVESLQVSAQLTTVVEADVTKIARLRQQAKSDFETREGVKLSFLPFFAKAAIEALKAHPSVNSSIDQEAGTVTYHDTENLGIAVDTERGLLVPVIHEAGDLSLGGIARKIADLAERTRTNKITPDELGGGTFTLTNTGSRGALFDTPIINQPQVAILGVGSVVKRPVVVQDPDLGEVIAIRSMVYLALTYDHRIVDGADAARFLTTVRERLEAGQFEGELGLA